MKGVRTVFAVLLFLMVTIDIFVNCSNEKGKTEEDPQSSVIKQEKQKPPEAAPAEIGQSAFDTAARHEEMAQKNAAIGKTAKQESPAQKSAGIKVTFIELGSVKCIPCKMMQPIMEEIEKEYGDQVKVVFYDVWTPEGQPYARQYGVRAIPTQVFLDAEGKEYYRHSGFFPKEELLKVLQKKGVK